MESERNTLYTNNNNNNDDYNDENGKGDTIRNEDENK